jgi:PAS domain S-box-containing protein
MKDQYKTKKQLIEELEVLRNQLVRLKKAETNRKRAEEDLKVREDFLQKVIEQTPNAIWISDEHGTVIRMNQALRDLLKITDEEIIGKYNVLRDVQVVKQGFLPLVKSVFEEGRTVNFVIDYYTEKEKQVELAHKTHKVLQIVLSAIKNKDGKIVNAICQHRDITERKQAEETLRESDERFRLAFENANTGVCLVDLAGNLTKVNNKMCEIFGYTKEELERMTVNDIAHPEDIDKSPEFIQETLQGKIDRGTFEKRYFHKKGHVVTCQVSSSLVRNAEGSPLYFISHIHDITDRKRLEEILEKEREELKLIIDSSPIIVFYKDKEGRFIRVNKTFADALKIPEEDFVGKTVFDLYSPQIAQGMTDDDQEVLQSGRPKLRIVEQYESASGIRWVQADKIPICDKNGMPIGLIGFAQDITDRKQTEEALRESEEKYRDLVENINDILYATDEKGIITYIAPSVEFFSRYTPSEIIGRSFSEFVYQEDVPYIMEKFQQDVSGHTEPHEYRMVTKSGAVRWVRTSSRPFFRETRAVGLRGVMTDITERKHAEEEKVVLVDQLRQSQKMEAIGRLAGGVAHDFNNLLTVIKGYCQLSLVEMKEGDPLREAFEVINKATEKAADLIRQLLAFSRRQIMEMRVLNLNSLLQNLDKMLRRIIGEDIELVTLLGEDLGRVKTDPGQIEQVVMNLAVNAKDAMPKGGKLIIETANVELDEAYAHAHVAVTPGRYVMIAVSDTGAGMAPEVRDRVFEPFFTTKEKGKGTGLGLSTVYGIVKQSSGNIWVYSEPGKGTTFKIYLPHVDEPAEKLKAQVVGEELPHGSETILIVEDDEEVRNLAVRILKAQGYIVLDGSYGDEAVNVCRKHKGPIHLLVTDVVMPGMDGRALSERLSHLHPGMKVLYMSGYTDDAIVHHGVIGKGMNYIQKPFTVNGLTRKVREVLNQSRQH